MRLNAAFVLATYLSITSFAHPGRGVIERSPSDILPFLGQPPGAIRAPCPGMNTLANHGYLPNNGRNITKDMIVEAFSRAVNMAADVNEKGAENAMALCSTETKRNCTSMRLDMLDKPHAIEHDASLSRLDRRMRNNRNANNHDFNQSVWDRTLRVFGANTHINVSLANTARNVRYQQAQALDAPGWFLQAIGGPITEHAFLLTIFNDPELGIDLSKPGAQPQARLDWINYLFTNQRFPTELGWTTPTQVITHDMVTSIAQAVKAAPTVSGPQGQSPFIPHANEKRDDSAESNFANVDTTALVQASAEAGLPPRTPDVYNEALSPDQWTAHMLAAKTYSDKLENLYQSKINV